jgi:hypothetical protein
MEKMNTQSYHEQESINYQQEPIGYQQETYTKEDSDMLGIGTSIKPSDFIIAISPCLTKFVGISVFKLVYFLFWIVISINWLAFFFAFFGAGIFGLYMMFQLPFSIWSIVGFIGIVLGMIFCGVFSFLNCSVTLTFSRLLSEFFLSFYANNIESYKYHRVSNMKNNV